MNLSVERHRKHAVGAGSLPLDARAGDIVPHEMPSTIDVHAAVAALDERGLRTGYADYWSAYTVTYLSGERIIVSPRLPPRFSGRVDRYPVYTRQVDAVGGPSALFSLVDRACELAPYVQPLEAVGAAYRIDQVARWSLISDIRPPAGLERETLEAWRHALQERQSC